MTDEQSQAESMPSEAEAAAFAADMRGEVVEEAPAPAEAPAPTEPVVESAPATEQPEAEPQAYDPAALEAEIAKLGYEGKSLNDVPSIIADIRSGMNKAQREAAETKQRYQQYDPLINGIQQDPNLARHLYDAAEGYYDGAEKQGPQPEFVQQLDPLVNKINSLEAKLANQEMQEQLNSIKAEGYPVSEEDANAIWNRVISTGDQDVRGHYFATKGPALIEAARKAAKKETVEDIQKKNASYQLPPEGPASETQPFNVVENFGNEAWEDAAIADIGKMMG
jgi:hypothetical protein